MKLISDVDPFEKGPQHAKETFGCGGRARCHRSNNMQISGPVRPVSARHRSVDFVHGPIFIMATLEYSSSTTN